MTNIAYMPNLDKVIKKTAIALLIIMGIGLTTWEIYKNRSTTKTGFVLIQDIYNGFDMKKEFEKKYSQTKNARDKILDSLTIELKITGKKIESEKEKNNSTIEQFNVIKQEYLERKQRFEEDNAALSKKYDQEIVTQLTQYVKDFGEKNHYTYIFGNDSNGSVMYAIESENITKEVTEFINNKYKGVE